MLDVLRVSTFSANIYLNYSFKLAASQCFINWTITPKALSVKKKKIFKII